MTTCQFDLPNEAATAALATRIADNLAPGDALALNGPLGAGKTAFARAVISRLIGEGADQHDIPSPTYTLVQTYESTIGTIWHADLFRLSDPDEVIELGLDEGLTQGISLIEWPDRLAENLPKRRLDLIFSMAATTDPAVEPTRHLRITPLGSGWDWLEGLRS